MTFSDKQIKALSRAVPPRYIRTRENNGRELSYIEGWLAISEANRIFGFDCWDRETLDVRCVMGREIKGTFHAVYIAKVRLTVRAHGVVVMRDGHGTGEARGSSPGEVHDRALKAAETDATKRALITFGKPFGLALYGGKLFNGEVRKRQSLEPEALPTSAPSAGLGALKSSGPRPARYEDQAESAAVTSKPVASEPTGQTGKTVMNLSFPRRFRDRTHLRFVATQPCLLCGRTPSDPHHLRFAQPRAMASKVSDEYVVPLCRGHHRQLHQCGDEAAWWNDLEIDALAIAGSLWEESHSGPQPGSEDSKFRVATVPVFHLRHEAS
jgi:hypothetical protein